MNVIKRFVLMLAAIVLPMFVLSACGSTEASSTFYGAIVLIVLGAFLAAAIWTFAIALGVGSKKPSSSLRHTLRKASGSDVKNDSESWDGSDSDGGGD